MIKTIVVSRTDSIGDVVLTLPLVGILRKKYPSSSILFLGQSYTKAIIESCQHINSFINWNELRVKPLSDQISEIKALKVDVFIHVFPNKAVAKLVKKAKIPVRIGTSRRWFHLLTCNRKVSFSRKKSDLHEAQLNINLLSPLGIKNDFSLIELASFYGFFPKERILEKWKNLLSANKFNLILHPKSQGSAVEWGIKNFMLLAERLDSEKFNIFFTGTEKEGKLFRDQLPNQANIVDLTGKMSLPELIAFIGEVDGLVAASTGPLHIASALEKHAIGLYSSRRPIHPGRWQPIGRYARYIVFDENCQLCKEKDKSCHCIENITPKMLQDCLETLEKQKL